MLRHVPPVIVKSTTEQGMGMTVVGDPPMFVTVKNCGVLSVPAGTIPKSKLVGLTSNSGGASVVEVANEVVVVALMVGLVVDVVDKVVTVGGGLVVVVVVGHGPTRGRHFKM